MLVGTDFFQKILQLSNTFEQIEKTITTINISKIESKQIQKIVNDCFDDMWEFIRKFEEEYLTIKYDDLMSIKKNFHKQIGTWQWLMSSKINRKIYEKSYGYSGDCEVMDLIYTAVSDSPGIGYYFDECLYNSPACKAVRNRKDYVISLICSEIQKRIDAIPRIFNLGSGPGRDMKELLEKNYDLPLIIYNIDRDIRALEYAKKVMNGSFKTSVHTVNFIKGNAFRIAVRDNIARYGKQDIIISSGLFDYIEDKYAIRLIKSLWNLLADNGLMIIGNFHPRNPTRTYMEWGGSWYLIYRDEERLIDLFLKAKIPEECIEVTSEPLGINLFAVVRK